MNFLKVSDFPKVTQLEALELGIDTGVPTSTLSTTPHGLAQNRRGSGTKTRAESAPERKCGKVMDSDKSVWHMDGRHEPLALSTVFPGPGRAEPGLPTNL